MPCLGRGVPAAPPRALHPRCPTAPKRWAQPEPAARTALLGLPFPSPSSCQHRDPAQVPNQPREPFPPQGCPLPGDPHAPASAGWPSRCHRTSLSPSRPVVESAERQRQASLRGRGRAAANPASPGSPQLQVPPKEKEASQENQEDGTQYPPA